MNPLAVATAANNVVEGTAVWPFYVVALIAILSTLRVVFGKSPVAALMNLVVSLLAVAVLFFMLGAPFAGALEIIIYAGAILVLFVFVMMMLNLGIETAIQEKVWMNAHTWAGPIAFATILTAMIIYLLVEGGPAVQAPIGTQVVDSKVVGTALFGPYLILVELASLLLLGGMVVSYHLGKREFDDNELVENAPTPHVPKSKITLISNKGDQVGGKRT